MTTATTAPNAQDRVPRATADRTVTIAANMRCLGDCLTIPSDVRSSSAVAIDPPPWSSRYGIARPGHDTRVRPNEPALQLRAGRTWRTVEWFASLIAPWRTTGTLLRRPPAPSAS